MMFVISRIVLYTIVEFINAFIECNIGPINKFNDNIKLEFEATSISEDSIKVEFKYYKDDCWHTESNTYNCNGDFSIITVFDDISEKVKNITNV